MRDGLFYTQVVLSGFFEGTVCMLARRLGGYETQPVHFGNRRIRVSWLILASAHLDNFFGVGPL